MANKKCKCKKRGRKRKPGRPKGSKNKKGRVLDPFKDQIKQYLNLPLPISSIVKIINNNSIFEY